MGLLYIGPYKWAEIEKKDPYRNISTVHSTRPARENLSSRIQWREMISKGNKVRSKLSYRNHLLPAPERAPDSILPDSNVRAYSFIVLTFFRWSSIFPSVEFWICCIRGSRHCILSVFPYGVEYLLTLILVMRSQFQIIRMFFFIDLEVLEFSFRMYEVLKMIDCSRACVTIRFMNLLCFVRSCTSVNSSFRKWKISCKYEWYDSATSFIMRWSFVGDRNSWWWKMFVSIGGLWCLSQIGQAGSKRGSSKGACRRAQRKRAIQNSFLLFFLC